MLIGFMIIFVVKLISCVHCAYFTDGIYNTWYRIK